jgi:hypothetical protein
VFWYADKDLARKAVARDSVNAQRQNVTLSGSANVNRQRCDADQNQGKCSMRLQMNEIDSSKSVQD